MIVYKYFVGREGQTINVDVWEQNLWQEIEGLKVMINNHRHVASKYSLNTTYVDSRITTRAHTIYSAYFFRFKTYKNHDLMIQFDQFLKERCPLCYENTQYLECSRFYNCPIIKIWRRNYHETSLVIKLYKCLVRTILVLRKLK